MLSDEREVLFLGGKVPHQEVVVLEQHLLESPFTVSGEQLGHRDAQPLIS